MATKCKKSIREDNSGVDFNFSDGSVIAIELSSLSEEMVVNLVLHGISQKVGDSYAGCETVEEAYTKANDLTTRLLEGDWKSVRASGGGKAKKTMLLEAFCMAQPDRTEEECIEVLEGMDDDDKSALSQHDVIKANMASIRAQRAADKAKKLAEAASGSELTL